MITIRAVLEEELEPPGELVTEEVVVSSITGRWLKYYKFSSQETRDLDEMNLGSWSGKTILSLSLGGRWDSILEEARWHDWSHSVLPLGPCDVVIWCNTIRPPRSSSVLLCCSCSSYLPAIKAMHWYNDSENVSTDKQHCSNILETLLTALCVNRIQVCKYSFTLTSPSAKYEIKNLVRILAQVSLTLWSAVGSGVSCLNELIIPSLSSSLSLSRKGSVCCSDIKPSCKANWSQLKLIREIASCKNVSFK